MKHIFSVTQVNSYIHRIFEGDYALKRLFLKGEISNCKYHSSGHIYFTLKDEQSAIRCILFASDRKKGLSFQMENGQSVIVTGRISVFEREGTYQLYAKEVELSGAGMHFVRLEQLKQELFEKGYFDFERKQSLPPFPKCIGIVTALTGAAIEDIKSVAGRRNPYVQLYLYPAKVQGEGAALTIAQGIRYFDREKMDIIIIGRGGGSAEDLRPFNERCVAQAIYEAKTPIISGTGHEIDMTIADYCADVRAATPSAACEMAIPDIDAILQRQKEDWERLTYLMSKKLREQRQRCQHYRRLFESSHPGNRIMAQRKQLEVFSRELHGKMENRMQVIRHRMQIYLERYHALSPTGRLSGGYVFAQDGGGQPLYSVGQLKEAEAFFLVFSDGQAEVVTKKVTKNDGQYK